MGSARRRSVQPLVQVGDEPASAQHVEQKRGDGFAGMIQAGCLIAHTPAQEIDREPIPCTNLICSFESRDREAEIESIAVENACNGFRQHCGDAQVHECLRGLLAR